eukprot:5837095-Alexandrium_andersonii.AAC.1
MHPNAECALRRCRAYTHVDVQYLHLFVDGSFDDCAGLPGWAFAAVCQHVDGALSTPGFAASLCVVAPGPAW